MRSHGHYPQFQRGKRSSAEYGCSAEGVSSSAAWPTAKTEDIKLKKTIQANDLKLIGKKTTTEGLCERMIYYIFLSLLVSGFSDQFSLKQAVTQHSDVHFPYTVTPQSTLAL